MAEESDRIKHHIDATRDELTRNLNELEGQVKHQVRQATDWRNHYRNHPAAMLGAAFAGGLMLAAFFRRG